jgi:hypothetical protein
VPQLLRIGDTSHGGNSWNGQIDDLRIYKRALTPAEITALYTPPASAINYDSWLAGLSTPPPLAQQGTAADPDGDGLPNLLEYALDGDPMNAANAPSPTLVSSSSTLQLTYRRARPNLTYTVETSSTLADGSWTTTGVTQDTVTPIGQLATASVPMDAPRRFLRLRVNEP